MSRKIETQPTSPAADVSPAQDDRTTSETKLAEFFDRNRDFFITYAGDASITAKPSRELGTFAIDLEKGVLYGDPSYYEKKGLTEAHAFNSFLHEFEHFRRLASLVHEPRGLAQWQAHRDRMKAKPHLHVFDNVLEDVSVDRAILNRAPSQRETQLDLYRTHLWAERDLTKMPKHLQFVYALFREQMLPEEPVTVADDVRAEIERLKAMKNAAGQNVMEVMSHADLPQSKRLALQERFFEPVYEKFFQQDADDERKKQREQEGEGGKEGGEKNKGEGKGKGTQTIPNPFAPKQEPAPPVDPDGFFKKLYQEYFDKSPDAALSEKQIEEALEKAAVHAGETKTPEELAAEAYAKAAGVSLEDLAAYQRFWETVEELRNPETDEQVVEELRATFRQIVTERMEPTPRSKQPVEDGEYLVRPAEAVAEVLAGRNEPRVWMTQERRDAPKELFGKFDVTIVCDRSGSMDESDGTSVKKIEQRKAAMLVLEALREFCEDLDDVRIDLKQDLRVRSEVWSFGGPGEVGCLKELSEELTDRQRVAVFKELENTPGDSTRDDLALEGIIASISEEDWTDIASGKLKKIVIVLTDGDSTNAAGATDAINRLRERGVAVVCIGITRAAQAALTLYAPDAHLAETASATGVAAAEILKPFIEGLNGS